MLDIFSNAWSMRATAFFVSGLLVSSLGESRAATLDVCPSGCTYSLIQTAIAAATTGDVVVIGAGTYDEHLLVQIDLTLQGEDAATTVVHPTSSGSVVDLAGESANPITVTVNDLTITGGNSAFGGGIASTHATIFLNRCVVTDNRSSLRGGGIQSNFGSLTITESEISNNLIPGSTTRGGAGIYTSGPLTLIDSTERDNSAPVADGGGIYLPDSTTATITGSTISGNFVLGNGGGMWTGADPTNITNSTISGNRAGNGAGIYYRRTLNVHASTITANDLGLMGTDGAGIYATPGAEATLSHSLVYGNVPSRKDNCYPINFNPPIYPATSLGYNVFDDRSCAVLAVGDLLSSDPEQLKLSPLQDNGGPTWTHVPLPVSLIVDAIPAPQCGIEVDQRGVVRPQGSGCDSGAVELLLLEVINFLIDDVADLIDAGVLNNGQGNALTSKLTNELNKIARGQTNAAANQLGAFINQVNDFVSDGTLTPEQSTALIALANQAIALLP